MSHADDVITHHKTFILLLGDRSTSSLPITLRVGLPAKDLLPTEYTSFPTNTHSVGVHDLGEP